MYEIANEEVTSLARGLIGEYHTHLNEANITYLFRDTPFSEGNGRAILGRAAKRDEIDKLLSARREDFVIIIVQPSWDRMTLNEKRCLLDHELCHCAIQINSEAETKWVLRKHVIEEFPENLKRFSFRREQLGGLIENPPSPIISKTSERRRLIRTSHHSTEWKKLFITNKKKNLIKVSRSLDNLLT